MNVAILGANGFVGGRLFEHWQRGGAHRPRAIVRAPTGLARVARFAAPDWRLADARDEAALTAALAGCEAVVHCVVGDERVIAATLDPVYRAAAAAGVKDLVFLSSASVHGLAPSTGTTEASPLRDDQPLAYNNAKVRAERRLQTLARAGGPRLAILRPGIVWGSRSRWVADTLEALRAGRAAWIDGGRGICNLCHVDNLVHAVERVLEAPAARGAYLVGDVETKTWRDFQGGLARLAGRDESAFAEAAPTPPRLPGWRERLGGLRASAAAQAVLPWFPARAKESVKAVLAGWTRPPARDPFALPAEPANPPATVEMSELYACRVKLPHERAARELGYAPPVSFDEGMRRTAVWIRELGLAG